MTYEDGTEHSETSAHKVQMPRNHPKDRIQHSWHGKSFKSGRLYIYIYDFKLLLCSECCIFSFWANPWHLNFMCQRFRTLHSIYIGGESRKNNWDKISRVFIQVKVWLKNSLSQLEGGGRGGTCLCRGIVCGGQTHQVESCSKYSREKWPCVGVRKGSHGTIVMKVLCFRRLFPFV